jgi:hypothetical protein
MSTRWPLSTTELIGTRFGLLIQVGNDKRGLERSHPPRPNVARQRLDRVLLGQQREADVVFHLALGSSIAVASLSLMLPLSRTFCTVALLPRSSFPSRRQYCAIVAEPCVAAPCPRSAGIVIDRLREGVQHAADTKITSEALTRRKRLQPWLTGKLAK